MAVEYAPLFPLETQFQAKDGRNNTGGFLRVFLAATDTPADTYKDYNGTRNPENIVLDSNGRAVVICDKDRGYRLEVYDANGTLLWTEEPVFCTGTGGGGAISGTVVESTDGTVGITKTTVGSLTYYDLSTSIDENTEPRFVQLNGQNEYQAGNAYMPLTAVVDKAEWAHNGGFLADHDCLVDIDANIYAISNSGTELDYVRVNMDVFIDNVQKYTTYTIFDRTVAVGSGTSLTWKGEVKEGELLTVKFWLSPGAPLIAYTIGADVFINEVSDGIIGGGLSGNTIEFVTGADNSATVRAIIARGNLPVLKDDYQGTDIQYEPLCRDLPGVNKFYFGRTEYEGGDTIYFCGHVLDGATDTWSGYGRFLATTDDLSGKIDKVTGASGGEVALVNSDGSLTTGPHVSSLAYTGMLMAYQPLSGMSAYVPYSSFGYNSDSQISGINGSAIAGAGVTGDYVEKSAISAESATWNTVTAKQDISGMSGYATTGDLAGKLDASASSDFYPMTGNPSSFLTEHQDISTKLDTSAFTAYTATALSGLENDVTGISAAVSGITGLTGTYVEQSAFNDYSAGVDSALGDKLDVTAYDSAKYPSVYWPYGLAQTTGQLLLQESRYPKYVQALVSGTGETASAGIIPPTPSSNLTSVRVLAADSGSLPNVSWIDYEPGYPTSNPSGFITSQVVTSTATQLYAGTAYLTSVNGTPISASRAGQAANATLATTAWYDSEGRAISSLASTGDLADYIPTSVSSQFLTSETVTATAGTAGYVTSINGSAISGVGGGGGGGDYDGVAPIHVDNVARKISVDYSALAVDETMTSYTSAGYAVIGVSTAGLVSDGFLTSVDLTPYQTTAGMSAYIPTSVSSQFLTSETVTATAGADGYITSINGSGLSGAGGGVTGDYVEKSSISAESANWNDTYSAVSSNSASWAAPAFPLEISTGSTVKAVVTTGFQDNTSTRPTLFISSNPSQTAYPRMLLSENRLGSVTNKSSTYLADAFEFYSAANNTAAGTKIFRADPTVISGSQLTAAVGKNWRIGSAEYDLWNGASAMSSKQDVSGMTAYVEKSAKTVAIGSAEALNTSLAQGDGVTASYLSFAQGSGVSAYYYSLVQGNDSTSDTYSLAQGYHTFASAKSLAQGLYASATGASLAQGNYATASGASIAQGFSSKSYDTALAQGSGVSASGRSLAQGYSSFADKTSLAQGDHTTAGTKSLAQGYSAWATDQSFAQGDLVTATVGSFAQGSGVQARNWGFAHGLGVSASASATVFGTFNQKGNGSADNVAFTIGNGTAASDRHDLLNVFRDGEITVYSATSDSTGFPIVANVKGVYGTVSANSGSWNAKLDSSAIQYVAASADATGTDIIYIVTGSP